MSEGVLHHGRGLSRSSPLLAQVRSIWLPRDYVAPLCAVAGMAAAGTVADPPASYKVCSDPSGRTTVTTSVTFHIPTTSSRPIAVEDRDTPTQTSEIDLHPPRAGPARDDGNAESFPTLGTDKEGSDSGMRILY